MPQAPEHLLVSTSEERDARTPWIVLLALFVLLATTLLTVPRPESIVPVVPTLLKLLVSDKVAHLVLYFVLSILTLYALELTPIRTRTVVAVLAGHAVMTEVVQLAIDGRHGEIGDCLADLAGIAAGLSLILAVRARQRSRSTETTPAISFSYASRD